MTEFWPIKGEKPFVALSIGHNEHDSGATAYHNGTLITEYQYADAVVNYVETKFKHAGLELIWVPKTNHLQRGELQKTIDHINQRDCDLAIELHFNSANDKARHGGEVFYCKGSAKGEKLAKFFAGRLNEWNPPTVPKDDTKTWVHHLYGKGLGFTRRTKMPAILLEPCFLSNIDDRTKLYDNWQDLGDCIYEAIIKALKKFWGHGTEIA